MIDKDNKQLYNKIGSMFGDTVFALLAGLVVVFIFGAAVAVIWDIINKL